MTNLTKTDRFILFCAALLLAVFSYFLYDDSLLFPRKEDSSLEQIGQVYFTNNDVRVKTATAFTWFPAQKTDDVHLFDSVFTGERSEAAIQLQDGTIINLKENSLITLNMKNGQMSLDLRYGDVASRLKSGSSLTITSEGKTYELQGEGSGNSTIRINKSSSGEVDLSLIEGSARMTGAGKKSEVIAKKKPEQAIAPDLIEGVTPDNTYVMRGNMSDAIPLEWKTKGSKKISSYDVEICTTVDCKKPIKAQTTRNKKIAVKDELKDGTYFWRVRGFDSYGKEVASMRPQSINLVFAPPPQITTPGGTAALVQGVVPIQKPNDPVVASADLSWKPENHFVKYQLQLSSAEDFSKVLHEQENLDGQLRTPALPNGTYYYHVRGVFSNGQATAWSAPSRFRVDVTAELVDKPEVPVLAERKMAFNPEDAQKRSPAAVPGPVVQWSKAKNALSYNVQFSRKKDFSGAKTYNVKGQRLTWSDFQPGEWNVRVSAVSASGLKSAPSEPGRLHVDFKDPILNPIEKTVVRGKYKTDKVPPGEIKTQWTETPQAALYNIEVSATPDFANVQKLQSRTPASTVTVEKPGDYFVRVQALDKAGKPLTGYSNVQSGSYVYKNALRAPALAEPFDKASIFLQSVEEPFIWLEWKKVKDVTGYEIEVSRDADFQSKFITQTQKDNRFLIRQKIPTGKLYWRVRSLASDEEQISDWTAPREFVIYHSSQEQENELEQ